MISPLHKTGTQLGWHLPVYIFTVDSKSCSRLIVCLKDSICGAHWRSGLAFRSDTLSFSPFSWGSWVVILCCLLHQLYFPIIFQSLISTYLLFGVLESWGDFFSLPSIAMLIVPYNLFLSSSVSQLWLSRLYWRISCQLSVILMSSTLLARSYWVEGQVILPLVLPICCCFPF